MFIFSSLWIKLWVLYVLFYVFFLVMYLYMHRGQNKSVSLSGLFPGNVYGIPRRRQPTLSIPTDCRRLLV